MRKDEHTYFRPAAQKIQSTTSTYFGDEKMESNSAKAIQEKEYVFDTSKYESGGWSLKRLGWELLRRGEPYQKTWSRISQMENPEEKASLEGPLWGLEQLLNFNLPWKTVREQLSVQLWPRSMDEVEKLIPEIKKHRVSGIRSIARFAIDLDLAAGDTRVLKIQLDRILDRAESRLRKNSKESKFPIRTHPRIDKEEVGKYLCLLDLDALMPPLSPKRIGEALYGKKLSSKQRSRRLYKDRKEARYLAKRGYIKFFVRAYEKSRQKSEA